jgi:hypothetical protein
MQSVAAGQEPSESTHNISYDHLRPIPPSDGHDPARLPSAHLSFVVPRSTHHGDVVADAASHSSCVILRGSGCVGGSDRLLLSLHELRAALIGEAVLSEQPSCART